MSVIVPGVWVVWGSLRWTFAPDCSLLVTGCLYCNKLRVSTTPKSRCLKTVQSIKKCYRCCFCGTKRNSNEADVRMCCDTRGVTRFILFWGDSRSTNCSLKLQFNLNAQHWAKFWTTKLFNEPNKTHGSVQDVKTLQ